RVRREVGDLLDLCGGGVRELRAPVAHVDVPQAREAVEVVASGGIGDRRAAPAHVDDRLRVVAGVMQRMDRVLVMGLDELGWAQRHRCLLQSPSGMIRGTRLVLRPRKRYTDTRTRRPRASVAVAL